MAAPKFALHGHFYQPERVIPEINKIPDDESAKARSNGTYSNWNEVINAECYRPNAELKNFEHISFDVYRTIFDWIKVEDIKTYDAIIAQAQAVKEREGISNLFASPFDHVILPLLKPSDAETEIYWGITDFLHRFGFRPDGFWLPETAVSAPVLKMLIDNGMKLTILAPWQAKTNINTNDLYTVCFADNTHIAIAFYHKDLSGALSFDNGAMSDANHFADSYMNPLAGQKMVLGATDGERYGHHLSGGGQFLHYFFVDALSSHGFEPTTITKYFKDNPPQENAEIHDMSSWSCLHGGLQRWKGDCDCNVDYDRNSRISGEWKYILYSSLKRLSEDLDIFYDAKLQPLLHDSTLAIKLYIHVILGEISPAEFLADHQVRPLTADEERIVLTLLTMQKYKLAAFTSCGFFFADIDRPEPRINIHNAKKAISLVAEIDGKAATLIESQLLEALSVIKSNFSGLTGKDVYYEYEKK